MNLNQYMIIVGCGRLGALLANRLSGAGHSIVVIDTSEDSFKRLTAEFSGFHIQRDATESASLKEAKVEQADVLLATTNHDNVNLMVAQVAKHIFNVPRVLARIYDPAYAPVYEELGIEVVNPTLLSAELFMSALH